MPKLIPVAVLCCDFGDLPACGRTWLTEPDVKLARRELLSTRDCFSASLLVSCPSMESAAQIETVITQGRQTGSG